MKTFRFSFLLAPLLLASPGLQADDAAVRMTREELAAFLPGTTTTHIAKSGSLRKWKNEPDGTFVASSDNKKYGSAMGSSAAMASGTWKLGDDGKYCVQIDWKRETEKWCSFILKGADGMFYLNVADDAHRIEFSR